MSSDATLRSEGAARRRWSATSDGRALSRASSTASVAGARDADRDEAIASRPSSSALSEPDTTQHTCAQDTAEGARKRESEEKRHRNHLAGQRFRAKKKAEAEMLEELASSKTRECKRLRQELEALQAEANGLKAYLFASASARALGSYTPAYPDPALVSSMPYMPPSYPGLPPMTMPAPTPLAPDAFQHVLRTATEADLAALTFAQMPGMASMTGTTGMNGIPGMPGLMLPQAVPCFASLSGLAGVALQPQQPLLDNTTLAMPAPQSDPALDSRRRTGNSPMDAQPLLGGGGGRRGRSMSDGTLPQLHAYPYPTPAAPSALYTPAAPYGALLPAQLAQMQPANPAALMAMVSMMMPSMELPHLKK